MPELPEVETTRRGLEKTVRGQKIVHVHVRRHDLRSAIPKNFAKAITGCIIREVRRRAKYLLIDLDSGKIILAHLGMSGSFTVQKKAGFTPRTHDHVVIELKNNMLMVFNDPRRFGMIDVISSDNEATHTLLKNLGPEPLQKEFNSAYLMQQLAKRKGPIKPVLMDQKLVVGVGNIYASEALYSSQISPFVPACELANKAPEIIRAIRTTLKAAINSGGSTLRDYVGVRNEGGYFQHEFKVYGRDGKPCFRCATMIETTVQAGRATYWCPQCQAQRGKRRKA